MSMMALMVQQLNVDYYDGGEKGGGGMTFFAFPLSYLLMISVCE